MKRGYCKDCIWAEKEQISHETNHTKVVNVLRCYRFPPQASMRYSYHPIVSRHGRCGEFKERE